MDTSKINEGDVIKNYKVMCNLLGEDIMAGSSKKAQLKEWERHCCFHKEGHKIIIDKIYSVPLKKPLNNNSVFAKDIESILTYELMSKEKYCGNYTKMDLFIILGMVNEKYKRNKRYVIDDEIKDYTGWHILHFYGRSSQKLSNILFATLNSMVRRNLIEYTEKYVVIENKKMNIQRHATEKETENILAAKKLVLESMNCNKIPFISYNEYYNKVNHLLKELYGWEKIFKEYQITYNQSYMESYKEMLQEEKESIQAKRKNLNSNIVRAVNRQAERLYDKNHNDFILDDEKEKKFVYPSDYLEAQKNLAYFLFSI